jgi:hypothetical protein
MAGSIDATNDPPNPERGYYARVNLRDREQPAQLAAAGYTLGMAVVKLDDYRDKALDVAFIAELRRGLAAVRAAGIKVIFRVRYNSGEASGDARDAPREIVQKHIEQLTPLMTDFADVIAVYQAGFIGEYGEWHESTNGLDNAADRAAVLGAMLDAVPATRSVQVRTPMFKEEFLHAAPDQASKGWDATWLATVRDRIGHHNDCFLASDNDAGTYDEPIDTWRSYVAKDSIVAPVGGETCRENKPRSDCASAVAELERLGYSFLSDEWRPEVLDAWDAEGCGEEIRARLGYRLSVIDVAHAPAVAPGGELEVVFSVVNQGFAAPFNPRTIALVLRNPDGTFVARLTGRDVRRWRPGSTLLIARLRVPAMTTPGTYELGLWLPDAAPSLEADPRYAIRLIGDDGGAAVDGVNVIARDVVIDPAAPGPTDPTATDFVELP